MNVAVLLYHRGQAPTPASLAWIDPFACQTLHTVPVPRSPILGLFPESNSVLIAYTDHPAEGRAEEVLEVYRLSDWQLRARLPMDCRAHFNVSQRWSPFLPSPDSNLIYVYKARTLGIHLAADFVCGVRLDALEFTPWNFKVPECLAGWSLAAGRAHAQMLFVADGLDAGRLPALDLEQKVTFWLGPEAGMGPSVSLGPRPRAHSDLGHARAILSASKRRLSVVVCNDGIIHLIDPTAFHQLERQRVSFSPEHAMPMFAAQIAPDGRLLYVGTAAGEARLRGLVERVVVHDLESGRRQLEWVLPEALIHLAMSTDGRYLFGAGSLSDQLWTLDARTGRIEAVMRLNGSPRYVIPGP